MKKSESQRLARIFEQKRGALTYFSNDPRSKRWHPSRKLTPVELRDLAERVPEVFAALPAKPALPAITDLARRELPAIREAFLRAQKEVGWKWQMKGRGHTPRASVNSRVGRAIADLKLMSAQVHGYSRMPRTVYPRTLVERAAEILNVPFEELAGAIHEK